MASDVKRELTFDLEAGFGSSQSILASIHFKVQAPRTSNFSLKGTLSTPPDWKEVAMIVRSITRCSATRRLQVCRPRILHLKQRQYSTSSPSIASSTSPPASMLGAFTNELDKIAPKFEIHGSQIQILRSPSEFYETLKVGDSVDALGRQRLMEAGQDIKRRESDLLINVVYRKDRARISKLSKTCLIELPLTDFQISTLQQALRNKPKLKLSILTDALRGTRESPDPSCASLLAPLVSEFGADRVEIRMYHTPNLTGLRKKYIPKRINEGWGLQHMKLYGMDDEIIISGYSNCLTLLTSMY